MSGAIGSILTNSGALAALNGIAAAQQANSNYQTQLSSGLSINSPADNPAGFIQAQGFTAQLNGISQAMANANEGISLLQTAQGAVSQQLSIAQKLNSIAVQAANGTQTAQQAQSLQGVVNQLTKQISTISQQTQFNNINLLDGSFQGVQFQVGANEAQTINLSVGGTSASQIGMYNSNAYGSGQVSSYTIAGAAKVTAATSGTAITGGAFSTSQTTLTVGGTPLSVTPTGAQESAASLASQINQLGSPVSASASTTETLGLTGLNNAGTANFTLKVDNGTAQAITGTSISDVVSSINSKFSNAGLSASANASGNITLTQASGKNITIDNTNTAGSHGSLTVGGTSILSAGSAGTGGHAALVQGAVSLTSAQSFTVVGGTNIGLTSSTVNENYGYMYGNGSSGVATAGIAGAAPAGAFKPGAEVGIKGSNGSGSLTISSGQESAKSIAGSVNALTNATNVSAQALTSATITLGKLAGSGGAGTSYSFTLGNGTPSASSGKTGGNLTNGVTISASSASGVISAINAKTSVTGITATLASTANGANPAIELTQASGANIAILNGGKGAASISAKSDAGGSGTASTASAAASGSGTLLVQGKVQFQSDAAFSLSGGEAIGVKNASNLTSLASINVSNTKGANTAINVVKYALQGLNNLGGQLGAGQQRLQATLNNLTATSTNLQNGLATVQDANIPQVSQKLTQTQIQAQAGVAALKSSSTLQQAYLSLLP